MDRWDSSSGTQCFQAGLGVETVEWAFVEEGGWGVSALRAEDEEGEEEEPMDGSCWVW